MRRASVEESQLNTPRNAASPKRVTEDDDDDDVRSRHEDEDGDDDDDKDEEGGADDDEEDEEEDDEADEDEPRQARVGVGELKEDLLGRQGFFGRAAELYHVHGPTAWTRIEGKLRPWDIDGYKLQPKPYTF